MLPYDSICAHRPRLQPASCSVTSPHKGFYGQVVKRKTCMQRALLKGQAAQQLHPAEAQAQPLLGEKGSVTGVPRLADDGLEDGERVGVAYLGHQARRRRGRALALALVGVGVHRVQPPQHLARLGRRQLPRGHQQRRCRYARLLTSREQQSMCQQPGSKSLKRTTMLYSASNYRME